MRTNRQPGPFEGWGRRALALALLVAAAWVPAALSEGTPTPAETPLKVVVHVNFGDVERQKHGLKNVENILKQAAKEGVAAEVEVVCHSDGITVLEKSKTTLAAEVQALLKQKVRFAACENTMRQRSIRPDDLLPGATTVPSGAFEVVRRQQAGYSYFKP